MRKTVLAILAASAGLVACTRTAGPELIPAENFADTVNGSPVALYTIKGGDVTLQVTNFGARVVSIFTPDKDGNYEDIVVG